MSPRIIFALTLAASVAGLTSAGWAQPKNSCSAAEQKSLETSFPLINAQVEQMRHSMSYISPQIRDQISRDKNAELANALVKNFPLTAEDEAAYRKAAAARICEVLTAEDRRQLASFYQGEEGKQLAKQQIGLYQRMFSIHSQIFQSNLFRALGSLPR